MSWTTSTYQTLAGCDGLAAKRPDVLISLRLLAKSI